MPALNSTPESRLEKRRLARVEVQRRNGVMRNYGGVQGGTTALLQNLQKSSGLSMDALLYKLARMGIKHGV